MITKIVNAGLIMLLAVVCAHWFWVFAAPQSTVAISLSEPDSGQAISAIQRASLFGTAPSVSTVAPDGSGLRLHGIFADPDGGMAIFGVDNQRAVPVRIDQEVKPGIRLIRVARDYVVVSRGGVEQRIDLSERKRLDVPPVTTDSVIRR